ncbi:MAG TPA: sulfotransferase, partial [Gammaproteobacteria bacterium]|nr:sulfotransferase [Gammaproteobacteria bacterium]
LANLEWMVGEAEEAKRLSDKALELSPDDPRFLAQKAGFLEREGNYEAAYKLIRPHLLNRETYPPQLLHVFLTLTRRFDAQEEALQLLNNALSNDNLANGVKMDLKYQAGHIHHEIGDYDQAFAAYREANALKPRSYYPEQEERFIERLKGTFTREFLDQAPRSGNEDATPVFIVGMPRSGTSLTEQIIASHPQAFGAGELSEVERLVNELRNAHKRRPYPEVIKEAGAQELARMAEAYLDHVRSLAPEGAERISDKMPQNFLHIGTISLMFPNARIIHTNRDPLDTCLSNYMQNFASAGLTFSYDLENLGHYYRLYQSLMEHWREVAPLPIYELRYEELVENPEEEIPRLLEFVGLPYDEACLEPHKAKRQTKTASYDQVRQPIYKKSKKKWRKYEQHLGPLMEALGMDPEEAAEA